MIKPLEIIFPVYLNYTVHIAIYSIYIKYICYIYFYYNKYFLWGTLSLYTLHKNYKPTKTQYLAGETSFPMLVEGSPGNSTSNINYECSPGLPLRGSGWALVAENTAHIGHRT